MPSDSEVLETWFDTHWKLAHGWEPCDRDLVDVLYGCMKHFGDDYGMLNEATRVMGAHTPDYACEQLDACSCGWSGADRREHILSYVKDLSA